MKKSLDKQKQKEEAKYFKESNKIVSTKTDSILFKKTDTKNQRNLSAEFKKDCIVFCSIVIPNT